MLADKETGGDTAVLSEAVGADSTSTDATDATLAPDSSHIAAALM